MHQSNQELNFVDQSKQVLHVYIALDWTVFVWDSLWCDAVRDETCSLSHSDYCVVPGVKSRTTAISACCTCHRGDWVSVMFCHEKQLKGTTSLHHTNDTYSLSYLYVLMYLRSYMTYAMLVCHQIHQNQSHVPHLRWTDFAGFL